ncbi:MAG: hypothetical protein ACTSXJ_08950 [Candidatus Baldrarchaeia archaeon]
MSQKYRGALADLLGNTLGRDKRLLIADVFLRHIEATCKKCLSNRIVCATRPICGKDRPFCSILVEINAKDLISEFCYRWMLVSVRQTILGKKILQDLCVYAKDLPHSIDRKKKRLPEGTSFNKIVEDLAEALRANHIKFHVENRDMVAAIVSDNFLVLIDGEKGIARVNPRNYAFSKKEEIEAVLKGMSEIEGVKLDIREEFEGLLILEFELSKISPHRADEIKDLHVPPELEKFCHHIGVTRSDNSVKVIIDLLLNPFPSITAGELMKVFDVIKKLRTVFSAEERR